MPGEETPVIVPGRADGACPGLATVEEAEVGGLPDGFGGRADVTVRKNDLVR